MIMASTYLGRCGDTWVAEDDEIILFHLETQVRMLLHINKCCYCICGITDWSDWCKPGSRHWVSIRKCTVLPSFIFIGKLLHGMRLLSWVLFQVKHPGYMLCLTHNTLLFVQSLKYLLNYGLVLYCLVLKHWDSTGIHRWTLNLSVLRPWVNFHLPQNCVWQKLQYVMRNTRFVPYCRIWNHC